LKLDKKKFQEKIDKIITYFQETDKKTKTEIAIAGSTEEQYILRVQEIQALKTQTAAAKYSINIIKEQLEETCLVRHYLLSLVLESFKLAAILSYLAISKHLFSTKPVLTL
jgi:CRISPR/Cas system-associated protein Csm6